jgi:hypothetical protein
MLEPEQAILSWSIPAHGSSGVTHRSGFWYFRWALSGYAQPRMVQPLQLEAGRDRRLVVVAVPSGTRREDLLISPDEHAAVVTLRRALAGLDSQHALELLLEKTAAPNGQFLRQVSAAK